MSARGREEEEGRAGRDETRVALALGSNLGNRLAELEAAVRGLEQRTEVEAVSSVWESRAVGFETQPDFLNAAAVVRTDRSPRDVLALAHELETRAGRRKSFRDAPRTLDVDIVLYGEATVEEQGLRIPHPRWRERSFVLAPLVEVAADWRDPETGRTVLDLWSERRGDLPPVRLAASPGALRRSER